MPAATQWPAPSRCTSVDCPLLLSPWVNMKRAAKRRCRKYATLGLFLLILYSVLHVALQHYAQTSSMGIVWDTYSLPTHPKYRVKTIGIGTLVFGSKFKVPSNLVRTDNGNECEFVNDHRNSDAVLFHGPELFYWNPVKRKLGQIWVFFTMESPANIQVFSASTEGQFNMTMTHMDNSDISIPYGVTEKMSEPNSEGIKDYSQGKSGMGVARTSQCLYGLGMVNDRLTYLRELGKHMPVDYFGSCFQGGRCNSEVCSDEALGRKYKFYFAFENSLCKDYITEKFWTTALGNNMVPVVRGGLSRKDYELAAPPHSFIYADDFDGPKQLADYLKYLDRHDAEYNKYFEWKRTHRVTMHSDKYERLCDALHESSWPRSVRYFSNVFGHGLCRFPDSFKKMSWISRGIYFLQSHNLKLDFSWILKLLTG